MTQPDGVHTIPVPLGWSPEQAWEAITREQPMPTGPKRWANILVEHGKYTQLLTEAT